MVLFFLGRFHLAAVEKAITLTNGSSPLLIRSAHKWLNYCRRFSHVF
jgi:hypothetical protein